MRGFRAFYRSIPIAIATVVLFGAVWMACVLCLFPFFERSHIHPVRTPIPSLFPVLVVSPKANGEGYKGEILYHERLEEYLAENPDYTLLVPEKYEQSIREEIRQRCRSQRDDHSFDSPDPWNADFKVERLPDGRQKLEVSRTHTGDLVNVGWYEATEKEFIPVQLKLYSAGISIGVGMVSLVLTMLLCVLGRFLYFVVVGYREGGRGELQGET